MVLDRIKEAIFCGNIQLVNEFINDKVVLNKFVDGDPHTFHEILSSVITANRDTRIDNVDEMYDNIILQLIKAAKEVHFGLFDGRTLLMSALGNSLSWKIIDELIKAGSDINAQSGFFTPLLCVINEVNNKHVITELINRGANVSCRDENGWTPLFHGMRDHCCCPDYIRMLLNAGSNVYDLDNEGRNILMIDCCDCFKGSDCKAKESIKILVKYGISDIDLKHTDYEGNTILHLTYCKYLFNLAIKSGIPVDVKNNKGLTPLLKEFWPRYEEKLVCLIKSGANVNCTNEEKQTLLHLWNWNLEGEVHPGTIYMHIYYGGNVYARNIYNKTPLKNMIDNFVYNFNELYYIIIKHVFLYEDNEYDTKKKDLEKLYNSDLFGTYLVKVENEYILLQETFIADGITFYEFCIRKRYYNSKCINISMNEYKYSFSEIFQIFPLYGTIIFIRIKDNRLKQCKIDLRKRFEKIILCPVNTTETDFHQVLNYDCLYHICRYLSYEEMFNIFCAAIEI